VPFELEISGSRFSSQVSSPWSGAETRPSSVIGRFYQDGINYQLRIIRWGAPEGTPRCQGMDMSDRNHHTIIERNGYITNIYQPFPFIVIHTIRLVFIDIFFCGHCTPPARVQVYPFV